jgi:hypothetical protein
VQRARQAGGAAADEEHVDLENLALGHRRDSSRCGRNRSG